MATKSAKPPNPRPVPLALAQEWSDSVLNRELARVFRGAVIERVLYRNRWVYNYREDVPGFSLSLGPQHETESGAWNSAPFYLDNPLRLLLDDRLRVTPLPRSFQLSDLPLHLSRMNYQPVIDLIHRPNLQATFDAIGQLILTLHTAPVRRMLALAMLAMAGRVNTNPRPNRPSPNRPSPKTQKESH